MNLEGRLLFAASNALAGIIFLVLSVVVARRGSGTALLKRWSLFCVFAGLFAGCVAIAALVEGEDIGLAVNRLGMSSAVWALLLFMMFSLALAGATGPKSRAVQAAGTVWAVALTVMFVFTDLLVAGSAPSGFSKNAPVPGRLMPAYLAFMFFTWAVSMFMVIKAYRKSRGVERSQAAYVLLGVAVAFLSTMGSMIPVVTGTRSLAAALPHLLLPAFPLIISYAVVRHRLWDIRTMFHRTAGWAAALLLFSVPLYGVLWLYSSLNVTTDRTVEVMFFLALFVVFYMYVRAFKPVVDKIFLKTALDRQRLLEEFGKEMTVLVGADDVVNKLAGTVYEGIMPEWVRVDYLGGSDTGWETKVLPGSKAGGGSGIAIDERLLERAAAAGTVLEKGQLSLDPKLSGLRDRALQYLDSVGGAVFMALFNAGRLLGCVTLSEKANLKPYTKEDLDFLDDVRNAASIALSNAVLFDTVDKQRRDLEKLAQDLEARVEERTRELSDANERLRELDRTKSRFFANISHELRTPLTLILVPVESILEEDAGELDGTLREQLEGVRQSAVKLLKLIDDLLDLSRLEEARLKLKLDKVDLAQMVERVLDFAAPLARRKEIGLERNLKSRPVVEADEAMLERVLVNLLSNALKFTDPGGRIGIELDAGPQRAGLVVWDTGRGIPESELELVFDRFHQVDDSSTKVHYGSGLGLALVKELVELHGGSVWVESDLGKGSRFHVEIPTSASSLPRDRIERRKREEPVPTERRKGAMDLKEWSEEILGRDEYRYLELIEATERRVVPRDSDPRPKLARLLVADDNPNILSYLVRILQDRYEVWSARDGEKALELLKSHRHDLVIADIMMPKMNGLELCYRIKSDPSLQDVPVILLTAKSGGEDKVEGHKVGADLYLSKPFRKNELSAGVENLLKGRVRRMEVAARRRAASLETLLAGMAHELRNASHQVQSAHKVLIKLAGDKGASQRLEDIERMETVAERALARINGVVSSLQRYSQGRMREKWVDLDLDDLVASAAKLVCEAECKDVNLSLNLESGAWVRGPKEELRQVVINLVENSIQAVSSSGRVAVSTTMETGYAVLAVEDDGPGVPRENLDRVFDLFFTTKEPGKGMGIGLAMCKRIVEDTGGVIEMESVEGEGARVVVKLPVSNGPKDAEA